MWYMWSVWPHTMDLQPIVSGEADDAGGGDDG